MKYTFTDEFPERVIGFPQVFETVSIKCPDQQCGTLSIVSIAMSAEDAGNISHYVC